MKRSISEKPSSAIIFNYFWIILNKNNTESDGGRAGIIFEQFTVGMSTDTAPGSIIPAASCYGMQIAGLQIPLKIRERNLCV